MRLVSARRRVWTHSEVVVPCQPHQRCCNLSVSQGSELTSGALSPLGRPRGEASREASETWATQHRAVGARDAFRRTAAPTSVPYYAIPDSDRVPYSNWQRVYFGREAGFVPNHTALRGWGLVAANGHKRGRNCTLHVGCSPV